jgi:hypothetical protein
LAALGNLDAEVDIISALETTRSNIKVSAENIPGCSEVRKHKPRFEERRSKLLDQRKHLKAQRLQQLSQINCNNLNKLRREANRHFKKKCGGVQRQN